jgi:hypothetical protein
LENSFLVNKFKTLLSQFKGKGGGGGFLLFTNSQRLGEKGNTQVTDI